MLGVRDADVSAVFHDAALAPLGIKRLFEFIDGEGGPRVLGYGDERPFFWIVGAEPASGKVHIAFTAKDRAEVDGFHAAGLKAGGEDNGAPGLRPEYHPRYYGAFVLDPDGFNIEAVFHGG
jgi:catechol 2,3-dioxygenase-like lactoylglutathione lyase family enzyme